MTASWTLVFFSSARGKPRSAKTFPELGTKRSLLLFFPAIPHLVVFTRPFQALRNKLNVRPRRPDARRRLFLEGVEHIYGFGESHGIYRTICVAAKILDDFKNSRSVALPRLSRWMLPTELRDRERNADLFLDRLREAEQVSLRGRRPQQELLAGRSF